MAKIEARINVDTDSHWYKSKYMLAFPFVSLAKANAFLEYVRNRDPHLVRDHDPKCLDLHFVDDDGLSKELIIEGSELKKIEHLIDIIEGAMRGLGIEGTLKIDENGITVDFGPVCGTDENPHIFRDKPSAGVTCLECGKELSQFHGNEAYKFGEKGFVVHK